MPIEATYPIKWITPAIATGYAPKSEADLSEIHQKGISVIVNLCAECYDLADIEEQAGFEVCRLFVADMEAPEMEEIEGALAWFDDHLNAGRIGLIHCRFGLGRTGTFALAYFIRRGDSLKSAIARLRSTPAIPQTRRQWKFIEQYAKARGTSTSSAITPSIEGCGESTFFKRQLNWKKWFR